MAEERSPDHEFQTLQSEWVKRKEDLRQTHAASVKSMHLNRYCDIFACDDTRVVLSGGLPEDYINANYIDGANIDGVDTKKAYISTQAPIPSTIAHFWHMIWQERCSVIVMLTREIERGVTKAAAYWPPREEDFVVYGAYQVTLLKEDTLPEHPAIMLRSMLLECADAPDERRLVSQIHYQEWPDHGAPKEPTGILAVIDKTNRLLAARAERGPLVVHCSAGIGRSGAFIATHIAAQMLAHGAQPDLYSIVHRLREQRRCMVQSRDQYAFVHNAVREIALVAARHHSLEVTPTTPTPPPPPFQPASGSAAPADIMLVPYALSRTAAHTAAAAAAAAAAAPVAVAVSAATAAAAAAGGAGSGADVITEVAAGLGAGVAAAPQS